jgi:nucleosome binding factor SPN SPT16 subunit
MLLFQVVQEARMLRQAVLQRDKERAERATLVRQEKLIRGKKVYKLPDLWVRPNFGGKGRKVCCQPPHHSLLLGSHT